MRTVLIALGLLAATPTWAQESSESTAEADADETRARELYANGEKLYEEGAYEAALSAWEAAYALSKQPEILYNMANALERIGRIDEAIDRLNEYRAFADAGEAEALDRRLRSLERRQETQAEGVTSPVVSAEPVPTSVPKASSGSGMKTAGAVLVGVGGAGLIGSGVLYGLAGSARSSALADCVEVGGSLICTGAAEDPAARSGQMATGATVALAAGGVLAVTGVALLVIDSSSGSKPTAVVSMAPTVGGASAGLTMRW